MDSYGGVGNAMDGSRIDLGVIGVILAVWEQGGPRNMTKGVQTRTPSDVGA